EAKERLMRFSYLLFKEVNDSCKLPKDLSIIFLALALVSKVLGKNLSLSPAMPAIRLRAISMAFSTLLFLRLVRFPLLENGFIATEKGFVPLISTYEIPFPLL